MSLKRISHQFFVMGGRAEFQVYLHPTIKTQVLKQAECEARRLEQKYSRYLKDSVVTLINQSAGNTAGINIDEETAALLDYAQIAYEQSDGLFDITSGVLRQAWDFNGNTLPDQQRINELLNKVGWHKVSWQDGTLYLPHGMEIDLGGIVKEYAADAIVALFRALGVQHGMVEMAGDIAIIGAHPDTTPWKIGIRDPAQADKPIASIDVYQGGVASSGNYERFMTVAGKRYCHILNPKTGWPVEGIGGVSVHATTCIVAGTAATIVMLLGKQAGRRWLDDAEFKYLLFDE